MPTAQPVVAAAAVRIEVRLDIERRKARWSREYQLFWQVPQNMIA